MSDSSDGGRTAGVLRAVAVQTALLSGAAHALWAWPLIGASDPRPYVFLAVAVLLALVGAAVLRASEEYRRLYALGAGTLAALLIGYVGWHGASAPAALAADPLAVVAKFAEAVGVVAFLALYRRAPPTSAVVERRRTDDRAAGGVDGETETNPTEGPDP
ncbi:hypothetical protein GCM10027435_30110 [Haloparvum alkalitolerans]|uniref:hypothetical protein n=1 Tax=Haloparvum alkalitolerans TaxID=1042953 RepID=UPI003CF1A08F